MFFKQLAEIISVTVENSRCKKKPVYFAVKICTIITINANAFKT